MERKAFMLVPKIMGVVIGSMLLTELWAVSCPIPASQIKAEWFQIDSNQKEAHAKVRDSTHIWTMNIVSKKYLLNSMTIQKTLEENSSAQTAYETLGCLKCSYRTNYQYPVDFWACGK